MIRVDTITWNSPNTEITPADHDDGTTQNDNFVSADDVFNDYRLVLFKIGDTNNGKVYTISDCVNGTPDKIMISGDVSSEIAAGDWLIMIPGSATICCEISDVRLDGSGNIRAQDRAGWEYTFRANQTVEANKDATPTNFVNTDFAAAIPPTARWWIGDLFCHSGAVSDAVVTFVVAWGSTSTDPFIAVLSMGSQSTYNGNRSAGCRIRMTMTGKIRNVAYQNTLTTYHAASVAQFVTTGYKG
jgi:hypothetical protein